MLPLPSYRTVAALACLLAIASPVLAERADRDKPIQIDADRITIDDKNKVHILEGRVTLTQGTLVIRSNKIVVTQDAEGFQKGVATGGEGGLARLRQKRDGSDEYVDGEAERIEHDSRSERSEFFIRAYVKSGQDEVRGQYIQYDGKTDNYLVTSGPNATSAAATGGTRVRAVIQPKRKDEGKSTAPAAPGATPAGAATGTPGLKAAPALSPAKQE
ncbi:MAG: lipopolysaccharide transport periplasmic protein LptA [Betaproteobacteria bacterium]|nr:lipopolysaccharide transport periplasmic protein LptA [Betaproteobacteria bacterium]